MAKQYPRMRCRKHPRYQGIHPTMRDCLGCHNVYLDQRIRALERQAEYERNRRLNQQYI